MTELNNLVVSIITVCFNSEKTIGKTLESVNKQTWNNIEQIIVDGDSSDNTLKIVKKHGERVSKIISEPDDGIYQAMNKGIKASKGQIIGFLNSDDFLSNSNVIESYIREFTENPKIDACYGDVNYVKSNDSETLSISRNWKAGEYSPEHLSKGWIPPHPSFYAKKNIFDEIGFFNEDLKFAADFDLMCRILSRPNILVKYSPGNKVFMLLGGATNSSWINIFKGNQEIMKSLKSNNIKINRFFLFYKFFSRIKQYIN